MKLKDKWWIVICNGKEARIIETASIIKNNSFNIVKEFQYEESRKHDRDLGADKPGKVQESANTAHHAYTDEDNLHRRAKRHFAEILSEYLNDNAAQNKFQKSVIITSPEFLGELRPNFSKHTCDTITKEIGKDLTHMDDSAIIDYVYAN